MYGTNDKNWISKQIGKENKSDSTLIKERPRTYFNNLKYILDTSNIDKTILFDPNIMIKVCEKSIKLIPVLLCDNKIKKYKTIFQNDNFINIENINIIINSLSIINKITDELIIHYKELKRNNLSNIKHLIIDLHKLFQLVYLVQEYTQKLTNKEIIKIKTESIHNTPKNLNKIRNIISHSTYFKRPKSKIKNNQIMSNKFIKFFGYMCLEINNDDPRKLKFKTYNFNKLFLEWFNILDELLNEIFKIHLGNNDLKDIPFYYVDINLSNKNKYVHQFKRLDKHLFLSKW